MPQKPKPFFDKISTLDNLPYDCITAYLDTLPLKNTHKEYQIVLLFLKSYVGSEDTYNAYRREIEKLLQWSWLIRQSLVIDLKRQDIIDYLAFIQAPPQEWIGTKTLKRFLTDDKQQIVFNHAWHPFVVRLTKSEVKNGNIPYKHNFSLSKKSLQATFATLSSFYNYLTQEEYCKQNPVAAIRQKNQYIQTQQAMKVTRKLSNLQWQTVIATMKRLSDDNTHYFRTYFILSSFYLLGLRISELAETPGRIPVMGDFYPDQEGQWWFKTVGKGNKMREVAVPMQLLDIIKQYRTQRGLTPLPSRGESNPLINKRASSSGLGTRQIRNLVQEAFDLAISELIKQQRTNEACDLEQATVHWLRHTAISHDVKSRPREHIRDDVGHSNPATMDQYIDIDRKERYQSAKHKTLLPEG